MTQSASAPGPSRPAAPGPDSPWAASGAMFAGVVLLVDGVLAVVKGIAGVASDDVYTRINNYTFEFGITARGRIHLILGVILAFVGWSVLEGAARAWGVGIGLAALNLIANFVRLPYQPVWAIISVALDTFVIRALCAHRTKPVI
ncbi:hypothetical protein [Streptomyces sp. HB132]|uniref:DUF7144 family membrane protein n=1 Tax=Streptomyces sp. HB132 TaxID=767388 RepID=UPI0019620484|nr:hypothetical protein [Streptomyces sp. HB132]MBM7438714.1 hypothetical protein [Streptomyces sp. HB132]